MDGAQDRHLRDVAVIANMAAHLRGLSRDVAQVSQTVSEVTHALTVVPPVTTIRDLQKIDALYQSLGDLARLCDGLASTGAARDRALRSLQLASTRALLDHTVTTQPPAVGTIDLF
jgi:hypothetical protein